MTRLKLTLVASALALAPTTALAQIPVVQTPAPSQSSTPAVNPPATPAGGPSNGPAASPSSGPAVAPSADVSALPAQIAVGMRVGLDPVPSGYDDGGRRDPFVTLVIKKSAGDKTARTGTGLASLAVADVAVKGIVKAGARVTAMLEGPDHMSYIAHPQDRLADGLVKSIDPAGVVFVEEETDAAGAVHPHEVRKPLHSAAEVVK
jgi:hypothetical protein